MRFICVYLNKFNCKDIDFKQDFNNVYYFNPAKSISKRKQEDHTDEKLSNDAINAYIFTKVRRAFDSKISDKMFYVIESFEESIFVNIKKMVNQVSNNFDETCPIDFFILEEDIYLLERLTPKMKEIIDNVIIYQQNSSTVKKIPSNHKYFKNDNLNLNISYLDEINL